MEILPTILAAVIFSVAGQILVKHGINLKAANFFSSGLVRGFIRIYTSPFVIIGSAVYILSILFWVYSLTKADLSFAYPFVSLTYVFILIASRILLHESIPILRLVGIVVICTGIILVSLT